MAKHKQELKLAVETVTPSMAREWLLKNGSNRPISPHRVRAIEKDIRAGKYQLNGESIVVSVSGLLQDGQHRCAAVVKAEKPVESVVVYGVADDVMLSIDQGRSKTAGDVFSILGLKYPRIKATVARLLWEYQEFGLIDGKIAASRVNVLNYYKANEAVITSAVQLGERMKRLMGVPNVTVAVCDVLISRRSERSVEFFEALASTPPAERGSESPLGSLQRYLRAPRRSGYAPKIIPVVLKTWNAWVTKTPMVVASFRSGEPFPEIES